MREKFSFLSHSAAIRLDYYYRVFGYYLGKGARDQSPMGKRSSDRATDRSKIRIDDAKLIVMVVTGLRAANYINLVSQDWFHSGAAETDVQLFSSVTSSASTLKGVDFCGHYWRPVCFLSGC